MTWTLSVRMRVVNQPEVPCAAVFGDASVDQTVHRSWDLSITARIENCLVRNPVGARN
jgi:hypothetical protein